jgi:hypothetical protein
MNFLPGTATCGGCLAPLRARMIIENGSGSYDPAKYLLFNFSQWHMEYFSEDSSQPIYTCPRCHKTLSYIVVPEGRSYDNST